VINYFQKEYSNLAVSNEKPSFPEFMLTNSEKVSYNVTDRGISPQTLQAKEQSIMEKIYVWLYVILTVPSLLPKEN